MTTKLRNSLIVAAISIIFGFAIGLYYGYIINPVKWVDVSLEFARKDIQEEYLRLAIDSYRLRTDPRQAFQIWQELGSAGPDLLLFVTTFPGSQTADAVSRFSDAVLTQNSLSDFCGCNNLESNNNNLCLFLWFSTITLGSIVAFIYFKRLNNFEKRLSPLHVSEPVNTLEKQSFTPKDKDDPPFNLFISTFELGNDSFSDTFLIESLSGEYLGECGVNIGPVINDKTPKKVTAFEVWLFDKNDIKTRSLMLMSDVSFNNVEIRTKVVGSTPVLAENGAQFELECDNLRLGIRVLDMYYSEYFQEKNDIFERLSLELSVWQK